MSNSKRTRNNWDIEIGAFFDIPISEERSKFARQLVYAANKRGEAKFVTKTVHDLDVIRITRIS